MCADLMLVWVSSSAGDEKTFGGPIDLLAFSRTHKPRIGMRKRFRTSTLEARLCPRPKRPGPQGDVAIAELASTTARILELVSAG